MHQVIDPAILYLGTPVVLVGTRNADGTANLAPISSAWWLGHRCVLGLAATSKTTENLLRTRACVLNLPSAAQAGAVDRIALTTGSDPVPEGKRQRGYRHARDKFALAGLTELAAERVDAPRAAECPVHLEAEVRAAYPLAQDDPRWSGRSLIVETHVVRVHVDRGIRLAGFADRIDPDLWRPLIMSFQHFYGLGPRVGASRLAGIPEALYRPAAVAT